MYVRAHTHTNTHTHAHMHAHMHTCLRLCMQNKQVELAVDWVTDLVWCKKASQYSTKRTPCAVINIPIDTADTRSIGWQDSQSTKHDQVQKGVALQEWALSRRELGFAGPIVGIRGPFTDLVSRPPGRVPEGAGFDFANALWLLAKARFVANRQGIFDGSCVCS